MEKPTEKHCSRCNTAFICDAGDIVNCQFYSVALNQAARNFLLSAGLDCLCKDCLVEINSLAYSSHHQ